MNTPALRSVFACEQRIKEPRHLGRDQDESEFTAMVERQGRYAFRVAYSLLRNAHDAEDAVQEMLMNLYRRRAWRGLREERAFVARATWRVAMDKLRQRKPRIAGQHDAALLASLAADGANPEREAVAADWSRMVRLLVDRLPEELRQPLALSTIDEMASAEIAAVMGIPEATVRTRLMRARRLLKEKIAAVEVGHGRPVRI